MSSGVWALAVASGSGHVSQGAEEGGCDFLTNGKVASLRPSLQAGVGKDERKAGTAKRGGVDRELAIIAVHYFAADGEADPLAAGVIGTHASL